MSGNENTRAESLKAELKKLCRINNDLVLECEMLRRATDQNSPEEQAPIRYKCPGNASKSELEALLWDFGFEHSQLDQKCNALRENCALLFASSEEKYQFIMNRTDFSEAKWLKVLKAWPNGYYKWKKKHEERDQKYQEYRQTILSIYEEGEHSVNNICKTLRNKGYSASHNKVKKIMEELELITPQATKEKKEYKDPWGLSVTWKWMVLSSYEWVSSYGIWQNGLLQYPLSSGDRYLTPKVDEGNIIEYEPLKDNALFAKFTDIKSTPDSFIEWADKYGMLFSRGNSFATRNDLFQTPISNETNVANVVIPLESLSFWKNEHMELFLATKVWEFLSNEEDLKKVIDIEPTEEQRIVHVFFEDKHQAFPIDLQSPTNSGIQDVAAIYLREKIKNKLKEYPIIVANIEERKTSKDILQLEPSTLLSAMWYQLLLAFKDKKEGRIDVRRCNICGKWESLRGRRSDWQAHLECRALARKEAGQGD